MSYTLNVAKFLLSFYFTWRNFSVSCISFLQEELRPFFSLPKVMDGLFDLAKTLFGIDIEQADGLAPVLYFSYIILRKKGCYTIFCFVLIYGCYFQVWNNDVRFYRVKDSSGNPIAYFYFDPYTRSSEKRGGAWMDEVVGRSRVLSRDGSSARLPVAHMVCNQTPPVGSKPSLMTFREVSKVNHFGFSLFSINSSS